MNDTDNQDPWAARAALLAPHLLKLLTSHFDERYSRKTTSRVRRPPVWVPEIDYVIKLMEIRDEVRDAQVGMDGKMRGLAYNKNTNKFCYILHDTRPDTVCSVQYIMPIYTLRQFVDAQYLAVATDDYRVAKSKTAYLGGVANMSADQGAKMHTMPDGRKLFLYPTYAAPCAAYPILASIAMPYAVRENTRAEWENMSPEVEAKRIMTKKTMLSILDNMSTEEDRSDPDWEPLGEQWLNPNQIEWDITEIRTGGAGEAGNLHPNPPIPITLPHHHEFRNTPNKIAPRAFGVSQQGRNAPLAYATNDEALLGEL